MFVAAVAVLVVLWRWIDSLALVDIEKKASAQLDAVKVAASNPCWGRWTLRTVFGSPQAANSGDLSWKHAVLS